jgi:hypothetical protein
MNPAGPRNLARARRGSGSGRFRGARLKSEQNQGLLGVSGPLLHRRNRRYVRAHESCLNE